MVPFGFLLRDGIKLLGAGVATGVVLVAFGATLADGLLLILSSYFIILYEVQMSVKMRQKIQTSINESVSEYLQSFSVNRDKLFSLFSL